MDTRLVSPLQVKQITHLCRVQAHVYIAPAPQPGDSLLLLLLLLEDQLGVAEVAVVGRRVLAPRRKAVSGLPPHGGVRPLMLLLVMLMLLVGGG